MLQHHACVEKSSLSKIPWTDIKCLDRIFIPHQDQNKTLDQSALSDDLGNTVPKFWSVTKLLQLDRTSTGPAWFTRVFIRANTVL